MVPILAIIVFPERLHVIEHDWKIRRESRISLTVTLAAADPPMFFTSIPYVIVPPLATVLAFAALVIVRLGGATPVPLRST